MQPKKIPKKTKSEAEETVIAPLPPLIEMARFVRLLSSPSSLSEAGGERYRERETDRREEEEEGGGDINGGGWRRGDGAEVEKEASEVVSETARKRKTN